MQFERWHSGVSPAAGLKSLPASVRRAASPNEKKKLNEIGSTGWTGYSYAKPKKILIIL
jgi:hypothetical protein